MALGLSALAAMMVLVEPGILAEFDVTARSEAFPPALVEALQLEVIGTTAAFLRAICEEIETNPLVCRFVVESELDRLREGLTDAELEADRRQSVGYFRPYVEAWYEAGNLRGPDPETVAHAIRAVTFLTLHEDDIGTDRYSAVRDLIIDAVAAGLTTTAN